MKKSISLVLALLICLSLCACSNSFKDSGYQLSQSGSNKVQAEEGDFPGGDDYDGTIKIIENEFIKTGDEAVSTFSADVDTASYSFFRRLANEGYDLSSLKSTAYGSLRTEEMINYFDYDTVSPINGELFGVKAELSACPWNNDNSLLVLYLQSEKSLPQTKGNNLVFLIDVSGSMNSSDKLVLLKSSFATLVSSLNENDTVSIVTYSGQEKTVLDGCPGNRREEILTAVNSLVANGSTNGEAGLQTAYALAEKNYKPDGNNRIIMASDGDLNVGISSADELKSYIETKRNAGVYLSVLGFGTGNYRDSNMEALADNGNGVYYYIDSEREAEKVMGSDLFSTLYTVAGDVKLQLSFNPEYIDEYQLIGYENRVMSNNDFENDTKDAGEIGCGHSVVVCYEIKTKDATPEQDDTLMTLSIHYKKPGETKSELNEYTLKNDIRTDNSSDDFMFISAVTELSMLLNDSKYKNNITLDNVISLLSDINTESDYDKEEFKTICGTIKENTDKSQTKI